MTGIVDDAFKALNFVNKFAPCSHEDSDAGLGDGKTWARCHSCGSTFAQEHWDDARQSALEFYRSMAALERALGARCIAIAQTFEDAAKIAELHDDTGESGYSTAHDIAKNLRGRAIAALKD